MRYIGSKRRISKDLLPIMLAERQENQWWVEPFVGGANMIDKVADPRMGNDIHKYLIAVLIAIRDGYIPPTTISEEEYFSIKKNPDAYPDELVGFAGFTCSFGAKWGGTYAWDRKGTNYAEVASRMLVKQAEKLQNVIFTCTDYLDMHIPPRSLIYCDPPYRGAQSYTENLKPPFRPIPFDSDRFWNWCRDKSNEGHTVFISEYNAPEDFMCIKSVDLNIAFHQIKTTTCIERLFKPPEKV